MQPGERAAAKRVHLDAARGVLHLGAHIGQESAAYEDKGKPVVWVEAMPSVFAILRQNIATREKQRALCALLSDVDGQETRFHISNNEAGVSSSVFEFGEYGAGERTLWPELGLTMVSTLTLTTTTLDTLLRDAGIDASQYDYWVVDLQGAELLALKGAVAALAHCNALFVEASTVEVYQGGVLWPELRDWLNAAGFVPLWAPEGGHDDVLCVRRHP